MMAGVSIDWAGEWRFDGRSVAASIRLTVAIESTFEIG